MTHKENAKEGINTDNDHVSSFAVSYIERCNKETEVMIAVEEAHFLDEKINYLNSHIDEFIYIESNSFAVIGVDSICIEVDDVFHTYEAMLGLKLPKKLEGKIKQKLNKLLEKEVKYSVLFNQGDGLWELNFALNGVESFSENMSIGDVCKLIYRFLFELAAEVKEDR